MSLFHGGPGISHILETKVTLGYGHFDVLFSLYVVFANFFPPSILLRDTAVSNNPQPDPGSLFLHPVSEFGGAKAGLGNDSSLIIIPVVQD